MTLQVDQHRLELPKRPLPELPMTGDPALRLAQRSGGEAQRMPSAVHGPLHQSGILEHSNVFGRTWLRDIERLAQFPCRALGLRQPGEHGPARRIRERAEHGIELRRR